MLLQLIRIILRSGQSKTRRDNTFNSRIIGQVQEKCYTIETTVLLEILFEETGGFHVNAHSGEDD